MGINKRLLGGIAALAAGALAFMPAAARAGNAPTPLPGAPLPAAKSAVPGWSELIAHLADLPDRMLARLPPSMQADPQVRQEVARLALEALTSQGLDAIGGDADAPEFLPVIGYLFNVGQPNADTIYRTARINGRASYRLRGTKGSLKLAIIAQAVPRNAETGTGRTQLDLSQVKVDKQGRFDVLLSAARPAGYKGEWWDLRPAANRLLFRQVSSDWAHEKAPVVTIERVDKPAGRPRRSAAELEKRLRGLPQMIDTIALLFVDHVAKLRSEGFINKVKILDVSSGGGLVGQFYYEGAYDLADDEALIVESAVPKVCRYRSLILTNDIYETTDWYNNHSSLNDAQAPADSDGKLRIVISAADPGVANWIDTAGHPTGLLQGRWMGCDSQPIPVLTKVKLSELAAHLPADLRRVTPDQRQAIIRARRAGQLARPLW